MPARRKPSALLEASGAFDKNPSRRRARENEPIPEGELGNPPAEWVRDKGVKQRCADLFDIWTEIVSQAPPGVLTSADRMHVETLCYLMYRIRRAVAGYGKATAGDFNQLNKGLAQIGMIPSERSRVHGKKKQPEGEDEWASIARERQQRSAVQ